MPSMLRMLNPIRSYAWGSTTAIPELLGIPADGSPQAELWLGGHPDSPSQVLVPGREPEGVDRLVDEEPDAVLGSDARARFGDRLPYLLKVLAAQTPLSMQVHPTTEQARQGYEAEQEAGVPQDAPHRRYRDPFHKPEMLVALTEFSALCGVRPVAESRGLLGSLRVVHPGWADLLAMLDRGDVEGVFARLLGDPARHAGLVTAAADACRELAEEASLEGAAASTVAASTAADLADRFPADPGVVLSLLLNRVTLAPGEALYLPAGNVHAYLCGTGLEIMAASDNVLRAGLTPKHVDVPELLKVADLVPGEVPRVQPLRAGEVSTYRAGAEEFELHVVRCTGEPVALDAGGPRVVLVLGGSLDVVATDQELRLGRGQSALVPHVAGALSLQGEGVAVVAAVPRLSI